MVKPPHVVAATARVLCLFLGVAFSFTPRLHAETPSPALVSGGRVRLTPPEAYEIEGLVRLDLGSIQKFGRNPRDAGDAWEVAGLDGRLLTLPKPSRPLIGTFAGHERDAVRVRLSTGREPALVPRASIAGIEVGRVRRHGKRGLLIGVAVGAALGAARGGSPCFDDDRSCRTGMAVAAAIPLGLLGGLIGMLSETTEWHALQPADWAPATTPSPPSHPLARVSPIGGGACP